MRSAKRLRIDKMRQESKMVSRAEVLAHQTSLNGERYHTIQLDEVSPAGYTVYRDHTHHLLAIASMQDGSLLLHLFSNHRITIAGSIQVSHCSIVAKGDVGIEAAIECAHLHLSSSGHIVLAHDMRCSNSEVQCSEVSFEAGVYAFSRMHMHCESDLSLSGRSRLQVGDSKLTIGRQIKTEAGTRLVFKNSKIRCPSWEGLIGCLDIEGADITGQYFFPKGKTILKNTRFNMEKGVVLAEGTYLKHFNTFKAARVSFKACVQHGRSEVFECDNLEIIVGPEGFGQLAAQAMYCSLSSKTDYPSAVLKDCHVEAELMNCSGNMALENVTLRCETQPTGLGIIIVDGQLKLHHSSIVHNGHVYSADDSKLLMSEGSSLNTDVLYARGSVNTHDSLLQSRVQLEKGKLVAKRSGLKTSELLAVLGGARHCSEGCKEWVGHLAVSGSMRGKQGVLTVEKDFSSVGRLKFSDQVLKTNGKLSLCQNSKTSISKSAVSTESLSIYGRFHASDSRFDIQSRLETGRDSSTHVKGSNVQTASCTLRGAMKVEKGENGQATRLKLNMLDIESAAKVSGDTLRIEASHIVHEGSINLTEDLRTRGQSFHNLGSIVAERSIDIGANGLIWHMGKCRAPYITFSSIVLLNTFGYINARGVFRSTSVLNIGVGGLTLAVINASIHGIGFDASLNLPTLPKDKSLLKNPWYWMYVMRTAASNFVPSSCMNIVNLGCAVLATGRLCVRTIRKYKQGGKAALLSMYFSDWLNELGELSALGLSGLALEHALAMRHTIGGHALGGHSGVMQQLPAMLFGTTGGVFKSSVLCVDAGLNISTNQMITSVFYAQSGFNFVAGSCSISTIWLKQYGRTYAGIGVQVQAKEMENVGHIQSGVQMQISIAHRLINSGKILGKTLILQAGTLENAGGTIGAFDLNFHAQQLSAVGDIKAHAGRVSINCLNAKEVINLIQERGQFAHLKFVDLVVETTRMINVDTDIWRKGSLEIHGGSMTFHQDIHSAGLRVYANGSVKLNEAKLTSSQGLLLSAKSAVRINQDSAVVSEGTTAVVTQGDIDNFGHILGDKVVIDGNHVTNHGGEASNGEIIGIYSVYIHTKENFVNMSCGIFWSGKYGLRERWNTAEVRGGVEGTVIYAEGKAINAASNISSTGMTQVVGLKGVVGYSRKNIFTESHQEEESAFGWSSSSRTKINTEYQLASIDGNFVRVESKGGLVKLKGTNIKGDQGVYIFGKLGVQDDAEYLYRRTQTSDSEAFGVFYEDSDVREHLVQRGSLSAEDGYVFVESSDGDVMTRGVDWHAGKKAFASGENVSIIGEKNVRIVEQHSRGFTLEIGGETLVSVCDGQPIQSGQPWIHQDPTVQHVQRLLRSNTLGEGLFNASNLAVSGVDTLNSLTNGYRNGVLPETLLNRLGLPTSPKLGTQLSIQQRDTLRRIESLDGSGVRAGSLTLNAKHTVTIDSTDVVVLGNAQIHAQCLIQNGVVLNETMLQQTSGIIFEATPSGGESVGVHLSTANSASAVCHQQQLRIGGELSLEIQQHQQTDAGIAAGSITGHVGRFKSISHASQFSEHASTAALSTSGAVRYHASQSDIERVLLPSGLYAFKRVDLHVKQTELVGSMIAVAPGGDNRFTADVLSATDVREHARHHETLISGNLWTLGANLAGQAPDQRNAAIVSMRAQPIQTVDFGRTDRCTEGGMHSVIGGREASVLDLGEKTGDPVAVHLGGAHVVKHEMGYDYLLEIPTLERQTANQLRENAQWLHHQLSPGSVSSEPGGEVRFHGMHFDSIEDAKAFAEHARLMFQFSQQAYVTGESGLPEDYQIVGTPLEDDRYGSKIIVYADEVHQELVIAVEGTPPITHANAGAAIWNDDILGIVKDGKPRSYNEEAKAYIDQVLVDHPGYTAFATGHSRGASVATAISRDFGIEAYVYDNPGLQDDGDYSGVYSFQSSDNIVNTIDASRMQTYHRGNVIELPKSQSTYALEGLEDAGSAMENSTHLIVSRLGHIISPVADIASRLHSHRGSDIKIQVERFARQLRVKASNGHGAPFEAEHRAGMGAS